MSLFTDITEGVFGKSAKKEVAEQLDNSVINRGKIGQQINDQRAAIDNSDFKQAQIETIEAQNQASRTFSRVAETQAVWNLQSNVDNSMMKDVLTSNYNKPKADTQQTVIYIIGGVFFMVLVIGMAMVLKK